MAPRRGRRAASGIVPIEERVHRKKGRVLRPAMVGRPRAGDNAPSGDFERNSSTWRPTGPRSARTTTIRTCPVSRRRPDAQIPRARSGPMSQEHRQRLDVRLLIGTPRPPRPALARQPRPVRHPRLRGHAPADPGRAGDPEVPRVPGAVPHPGGVSGCAARDVIRAWAPLGYNRRAVRLHELAQSVTSRGGSLPSIRPSCARWPGSANTPPPRSPVSPSTARFPRSTRTSGGCSGGSSRIDIPKRVSRPTRCAPWRWRSCPAAERGIGTRHSWISAPPSAPPRGRPGERCPIEDLCASGRWSGRARRGLRSGPPKRGRAIGPKRPSRPAPATSAGASSTVYAPFLRARRLRSTSLGRRSAPTIAGDRPWLLELVRGLERDGLARIRGGDPSRGDLTVELP